MNRAAHPTIPADRDILVCVFQRGAADALNSLAPYGDGDYLLHRPDIALPAPGGGAGAGLYIDDDFALHPALAPLAAVYSAGDLLLVQATGVPHGSRSHFAAQNRVERGITSRDGPLTGWLGRHLQNTPAASASAFRAISISGNVPVALSGASDPLAIDNLDEFAFDDGILDLGYTSALADLFRTGLPFAGPAQAALAALDELQAASLGAILPDNGALYPDGALGNRLGQAARLIKSTLPVEVICVDSDGWDHHESLPTYIDASLGELGAALGAFNTDLGTAMARVCVLVYTEFGRRIVQNGSLGVDHGTGSLAMVLGGGVNGGQLMVDWPGLDIGVDEDLQITTDLRSIIGEMLDKRVGGVDLASVFPGFTGPIDLGGFI